MVGYKVWLGWVQDVTGLGDSVTEAAGRTGARIDRLIFGITRHDAPNEIFDVGQQFGVAYDATPPPKQYGPCSLVNIELTYDDQNNLTSIK